MYWVGAKYNRDTRKYFFMEGVSESLRKKKKSKLMVSPQWCILDYKAI